MTSYLQGSNAVLTVSWTQYDGGPAVDVTGVTFGILALDASVVLAPTSSGVVHVTTGLYSYTYAVPVGLAAGSYVAVWGGTYSGSPVSASEQFTVTSASTPTVAIGTDQVMYCTLEDVKAALDILQTARSDRQILRNIRSSTISIEGQMGGRYFYPLAGTMKKDWPDMPTVGAYPWRLWLDEAECISLTSVTSGGTALTPAQYLLEPVNFGPPFNRLEVNLGSNGSLSAGSTWQQSVVMVGVFGGCPADTEPAGTLAAALSTSSATTATVTDSATVGVGSLLLVDSERMLVTAKTMTSTAQTLQADMAATAAAQILSCTDGTKYTVGEVLLLDAERMLITDIAANNLIVKRNWDGSTLAAHTAVSNPIIYAARLCTVVRGALGTTAATHSTSAPILAHLYPSTIRSLCVAETVVQLLQEQAGYARTAGSGDNIRMTSISALNDLRKQAVAMYGRKTRKLAV